MGIVEKDEVAKPDPKPLAKAGKGFNQNPYIDDDDSPTDYTGYNPMYAITCKGTRREREAQRKRAQEKREEAARKKKAEEEAAKEAFMNASPCGVVVSGAGEGRWGAKVPANGFYRLVKPDEVDTEIK